ncbi:hypothetical protein MKW98_015046 [Papaver atlanticum]|uniref:Uncharacterized protein n=1 Tax=Papaver atlanticum TaxID=357466 RepID=A0AAD4X976_9MAGN|nr:hypothetical protein MKW98_015046 [Papaver atlanticum]
MLAVCLLLYRAQYEVGAILIGEIVKCYEAKASSGLTPVAEESELLYTRFIQDLHLFISGGDNEKELILATQQLVLGTRWDSVWISLSEQDPTVEFGVGAILTEEDWKMFGRESILELRRQSV